jgi:tetratricopeptide (TPR) repeat protein
MYVLKVTIIVLLAASIAGTAIAETNDEILSRARKLVEDKKHDQALEEYKKIDAWLRHDPGLVIELARVHTYADHHPQAIMLFEEVRSTHPNREAEILRELGDQYKWNGDYESSIAAYEKAMKNNPADIVSKRGLLEALVWDKKQKEKTANYNEVFDKKTSAIVDRPETNDDILKLARKLVEEKKYEQAIEEYGKIDDWVHSNPNLAIEFARVNTYADRHPQAIMLFEETRTSHPERSQEVLRELGDQYKWNKNLPKAIQTYEEALKNDPENVTLELGLAEALAWNGKHYQAIKSYDKVLKKDPNCIQALLAKAEVLSWMDRLEESQSIYKRVLELDPGNLKAMTGEARVLVWQGYHRKGVEKYEAILKEHPDEAEALEGMAYGYHWDGNESKSIETARRAIGVAPNREAAKNLYMDIQSARAPYTVNYNWYWEDKNKLSVEGHGQRVGLYPDDQSMIEGIYEWRKSRQKNNGASKINVGGLGLRRKVGDNIELNSYLYGSNFGHVLYTAFTTDTWMTIRPDDIWRVDLSYNRGTFDDVGSIYNKIVTNGFGTSFDFKPNRFFFASSSFKRSLYSDGNTQNTVFTKLEYRLCQKPYIKAYYNYYYSGWGKMMNSGYFNPRKEDSHSGGGYISFDMTKQLFVEFQGSGGYEYQTPKAYHPTYFFGGSLNYRLSSNWTASVHAETFKAFTDANSNGYSRQAVVLSVTYSMGAEAPELFRTTRPSRPVTGR